MDFYFLLQEKRLVLQRYFAPSKLQAKLAHYDSVATVAKNPGAKISTKFREKGNERMLCRELNPGGSFGSLSLCREIGVGQASLIDEIMINWPGSQFSH
ncbi:MAG: hypothetical protein ACKVU0_10550 [Saprospiraceae bacterium]